VNHHTVGSVSFSAMLDEADTLNRRRTLEREAAHLPVLWDHAALWLDQWQVKYNYLMENLVGLNLDAERRVKTMRDELHRLAVKLNGFEHFGIAYAPVYARIEALLTADKDAPLRWGQKGELILVIEEPQLEPFKVRARFKSALDDPGYMVWPHFDCHAMGDKFVSSTGYASCQGYWTPDTDDVPITPEVYVRATIRRLIRQSCIVRKGKDRGYPALFKVSQRTDDGDDTADEADLVEGEG
jgi:hypothetical protein